MTIQEGDLVPEVTLRVMGEDGPEKISSTEYLKGRKVILFAVPGAFTPACHINHLPGYVTHYEAIMAKGADAIGVLAVNDVWVMNEWAKTSGGKGKIDFLSDGNADFARAVGMDIDMSGGGLGVRSKRYSMIVDDRKVIMLNLEDNPGKVDLSGAAKAMDFLSREFA